MKCIFIYNPKSGRGKLLKHIDYICKELENKYDIVEIYATKSQEDTIRIAKESCGKYDALIFAGGDGTFNDVICGISSEPIRPVLGYIPSGTANDIAKNLKISKNYKKALKVIMNNYTMKHDVGLINNERYFVYVVGAGTFTAVSYRTKQNIKKFLGRVAYVVDGISDLLNPIILNIKVTSIEGEIIEGKCPLFLVANTISVGGLIFNRRGHANDGTFDIILVKKYLGRGLISIFNTLLIGIRLKKRTRYYQKIKASECLIETDDFVQWCIDGEKGMQGTIKIKNIHHHFEIFVPMK